MFLKGRKLKEQRGNRVTHFKMYEDNLKIAGRKWLIY